MLNIAIQCCLWMLLATSSFATGLVLGDQAPDFTLPSQHQGNLRLSEQRGKIVLLSFSASWCGNCKQHLKQLRQLQQRYPQQDFQIWVINIDDDDKNNSTHQDLIVLSDTKHEAAQAYKINDLPSIVIVDRDGNMRHLQEAVHSGNNLGYENRVKQLLQEPLVKAVNPQ